MNARSATAAASHLHVAVRQTKAVLQWHWHRWSWKAGAQGSYNNCTVCTCCTGYRQINLSQAWLAGAGS